MRFAGFMTAGYANQVQALKKLAIMGGLLAFAVMGAGRYSADELLARRS
ncbi:MAG TPA: hypothetical protein VKT73_10710 [Xanthobacteraceae bacterium]|nr:hypothetical protein [Xanthobacteraceae bacterium]